MLFPSIIFLFCFLPIILVSYFIICGLIVPSKYRIQSKNAVLLIGSLVFYAYGEHLLTLLLVGSILVNWLFGILIGNANEKLKKFYLVTDILINVGVFVVYKYLDFILMNLNKFTGAHLKLTGLTIPLGISFFTFQALSYVIDVYRGKVAVQKNPFYLGLYISLFPQLIAGPIVRYETIEKEIRERKETVNDFSEGIRRFIIGLSKKAILADTFVIFADKAFAINNGDTLSVMGAWFGALAFTLQIYFDFSGYSDMAIGLGRMFGFHFNENFNYPYISRSVTEFWRRWHISLSSWFRDYVYIPLGGNRVSKGRMVINLFLVWALTGIWHGASWTFIFWGLMYFALLMLERVTGYGKKWQGVPFFSYVYTLAAVMVCWVVFRAESMSLAAKYIGCMFGIKASGGSDATTIFLIKDNLVMLVIGIVGCTPVLKMLGSKGDAHIVESDANENARETASDASGESSKKVPGDVSNANGKNVPGVVNINKKSGIVMWLRDIGLIVLLLISIVYILRGGYSPFIYFNF